ncbi:hypothetical protein LINPERPRIM_LOCUS1661 [Linum perenne]
MEGEQKRPKGGFFHMFYWNGKSGKKLIVVPKNSDSPEETKICQENVELHKIEIDDRRGNACSDEACGTRSPSVVARLMGLDSLPTSNAAVESASTLGLHTSQVRNTRYGYNPVHLLNVSSRMGRNQCQLTERFQIERRPPRPAMSTPFTNHKLPSPVKCHGIVSTKKMIESSPKATTKKKIPSIGSPSVPMRIRNLKQEMEDAHKVSRPRSSRESSNARNLKGQHGDESNSGSESVTSSSGRHVMSRKVSPESRKENWKSVSQSASERTNVRRKDGSPTKSNSRIKQKENTETKSNLNSQPGVQKIVDKKNSESRKNELRQNHLKQNSPSKRDSSTLKHSVLNSGSKKDHTQARKMASGSLNSEKEKKRSSPQKKQPSNKDLRSIKSTTAAVECANSSTRNGKNSKDAVSFTFSSPKTKTTTKLQTSGQATRTCNGYVVNASTENGTIRSSTSVPGLSMSGADELGVLVEQELTDKVESSIREYNNCTSHVTSLCGSVTAKQKASGIFLGKEEFANVECLSVENSPANSNHQQQSESPELSSYSSYSSEGDEQLETQHPSSTSMLCQVCSDAQGSDDQRSPSQSPNNFSKTLTSRTLDKEPETELFPDSQSGNWELHYVRNILQAAETRLEDQASGHTHTSMSIPLSLFESEETKLSRTEQRSTKLDRKVVFDCIAEFLDSKCSRRRRSLAATSWEEAWSEIGAVELHREMLGWQSMGDLVVDELVDRDMSTRHGRWVDFDLEAAEEGCEIEVAILASLVDELASDLLGFY